jgi:hypothetical protein
VLKELCFAMKQYLHNGGTGIMASNGQSEFVSSVLKPL